MAENKYIRLDLPLLLLSRNIRNGRIKANNVSHLFESRDLIKSMHKANQTSH
jgi:hypothetical protein